MNNTKKLRIAYRILLIFIGTIGISTTSCQYQKLNQLEESTFLTDSIFSESLSEYRKHNVYLPKGFNREKKYQIIYATDGNTQLTYQKMLLDSLIDNQIIQPLIFVASFSNNKVVNDTSMRLENGKKHEITYRYFEYVNQKFPENNKYTHLKLAFNNHLKYFSTELIPYIEKELNQTLDRNDRYFYGVSNGASFGLSLLNIKPNLIGTYLCFSAYGEDIQYNNWNTEAQYPNLYYTYGSEETFLKSDAEFLKSKYSESNSFIAIKEYEGGHYYKLWEKEFIEVVGKILK